MTQIRPMRAAITAAATLLAASAQATVLTYTFGGIITDVEQNDYPFALPAVGETVSGTLIITSPPQWDSSQTDGTTVNYARSDGVPGLVGGNVTSSGGSSFSLSSGAPGSVEELILRDATGEENEIGVSGTTRQDGYDRTISVVVWDANGANSTLFADPGAGVSFSQPIDLQGENQGVFLGAESFDLSSSFVASYTLTSLAISAAVPEPANAALLLAGLCGLGLIRRRSARGWPAGDLRRAAGVTASKAATGLPAPAHAPPRCAPAHPGCSRPPGN